MEQATDLSDERMPSTGWDNWERVQHHLGIMQDRDDIIHSGEVAPFDAWKRLRDQIEEKVIEPLEDIMRRNFVGGERPAALPVTDVATILLCLHNGESLSNDLKEGRVLNPKPVPYPIGEFEHFLDLRLYLVDVLRGEDVFGIPQPFQKLLRTLRESLNDFDERVAAWKRDLAEKGIAFETDEEEDDGEEVTNAGEGKDHAADEDPTPRGPGSWTFK